MNPFLRKLDLLISLLNKKNIVYEIDDSNSLAPLLTFKFQNSIYITQMEVRDSLECTLYKDDIITNKIPLYSEHVRSLNIANAVSIVVYEGMKQLQQNL